MNKQKIGPVMEEVIREVAQSQGIFPDAMAEVMVGKGGLASQLKRRVYLLAVEERGLCELKAFRYLWEGNYNRAKRQKVLRMAREENCEVVK